MKRILFQLAKHFYNPQPGYYIYSKKLFHCYRKVPNGTNRTSYTHSIMLTRNALNQRIDPFIGSLHQAGYGLLRVVLFGSYAKGSPHEWSDIDLAVWDA
jgi:hypothetical protein